MIVFVEGVDGSGKSKLTEQLKEKGYKTHTVNSSSEEVKEWMELIEETDTLVMDRGSFISDLVYRIVDGKPRRGMDLFCISAILKTPVKIIYCKTDTAFDDAIRRGEDNIVDRNVHDELCNTYDKVMRMFSLFTDVSIITYNWKTDSVSNVINFIERRN